MYGVVEVAGKQFRVAEGDTILVDQPSAAEVKARVLMIVDGDDVVTDRSVLDKVSLTTSVHGEVRGKRTRVMKFKPKQGRSSKRIIGHSSRHVRVRIDGLKR